MNCSRLYYQNSIIQSCLLSSVRVHLLCFCFFFLYKGVFTALKNTWYKNNQRIYFCFLVGGIKCPVCSFVYGTKWEFNRHLKNKHGMKLVEHDGETKWEVKHSCHGFDLKILKSYVEKVKKYSKMCSWLYNIRRSYCVSFPFWMHTLLSLNLDCFHNW